jgi:carbonic anhydrase
VLLKAAITGNVWQAMEDMLRLSPLIREKVKDGQAQVVGALYDLDSGQVQWLGPHPDQEKLVGGKKGAAGKSGKKAKKSKKSED